VGFEIRLRVLQSHFGSLGKLLGGAVKTTFGR
jgi:hypothetical protein